MTAHAIYELRNYVMHPGKRDALIDLFEREFIESQEALGSHVVGTFRNLDEPDRFVWLRSFETMETRARALDGFYTGALWLSLRNEANATMIDSDDVLQLRPVGGDATRGSTQHPPPGAVTPAQTLIVADTYFLADRSGDAFAAIYEREALPVLRDLRLAPFAAFATEHAPNNYPRLPIREKDTVFVALTYFDSIQAHENVRSQLTHIAETLAPHTIAPTHTMRLQPTARSLLR
jgi:hypothetical protein